MSFRMRTATPMPMPRHGPCTCWPEPGFCAPFSSRHAPKEPRLVPDSNPVLSSHQVWRLNFWIRLARRSKTGKSGQAANHVECSSRGDVSPWLHSLLSDVLLAWNSRADGESSHFPIMKPTNRPGLCHVVRSSSPFNYVHVYQPHCPLLEFQNPLFSK